VDIGRNSRHSASIFAPGAYAPSGSDDDPTLSKRNSSKPNKALLWRLAQGTLTRPDSAPPTREAPELWET
jgi:hypothetical protein